MRAVAKTQSAPGIALLEFDVPVPSADEVLVKVSAVGICGSDLHIFDWSPNYEFLTPYFPLILGHEFAGEIADIGSAVGAGYQPGDRVTGETGKTCGVCFYCRKGQSILCSERLSYGRIGLERNGAMASFVTVPATCLHRVPPTISLEAAALSEPAAVALGAVRLSDFDPGDNVVVLGPGPIGLLILQFCKALGAGTVVVVGLPQDLPRLKVAERLGANEVVIAEGDEAIKQVLRITNAKGVGTVLEASGSPHAAEIGLQMLRKAGTMVMAGIYPRVISLDATHHLVRQMKSIRGSYGGASLDWDRVLNFAEARKIALEALISEVTSLEKAEEAFGLAHRKEVLKVLLKPCA